MYEILIDLLMLLINLCYIMPIGLFETWMVFPLLTAVGMACLFTLDLPYLLKGSCFLAYVLTACVIPAFCFFIPVLLLAAYEKNFKFFGYLAFIPCFIQSIRIPSCFFILVLSICAMLIKQWFLNYQALLAQYHLQRDTLAENAILLKQKNQYLAASKQTDIQIATLDERNRISRDLHDTVGHLLSSALIQVGALEMINKQDQLKEPLSNLKNTLKEGIENTRKSVHELYDTSLDLDRTISKLTQELSQEVYYTYQLHSNLPNSIQRQLLAIFQEAIHNIQKHSNASKVQISLIEQPGFYQFQIADNGTKISRLPGGIGLDNIAKRVNEMNGHLTIDQKKGFKIFFTIPKELNL